MERENNKIILEGLEEIELLQNAVEIAIASGDCISEELFTARKLSQLLEDMHKDW